MRTRAPSATATTGCSTARRCGSPTARSPTSRSSGRRPTTAIRGFVVPTDTPGFSAREIQHKLSLRAVGHRRARARGRPAAGRRRAARACTGLRGPLSCLTEARFGIVWGALGAARDCLETAIAYAGDREQFGRPIAGFQLTQKKLADMALELDKGFLLALPPGPAQGRRHAATRAGQRRQAQQRARGARHRPRVPHDPRRPTGSPSSTPCCGTPTTWSRC